MKEPTNIKMGVYRKDALDSIRTAISHLRIASAILAEVHAHDYRDHSSKGANGISGEMDIMRQRLIEIVFFGHLKGDDMGEENERPIT